MKALRLSCMLASLSLICLATSQCEYSTLDGGSYAYGYYDGDLTFRTDWVPTGSKGDYYIQMSLFCKDRVYYKRGSEKHQILSKLHNDLNSPIGAPIGNYIYARDIESINLYSDKVFDDNHPAGSSLLDLTVIYNTSVYKWIQNGYKNGSQRYMWGDSLQEKDLYMLGPENAVLFHFESLPQYDNVQHLFLDVTFSTGETITLDSVFDFGEHVELDSETSWAKNYNLTRD